MSKRILFIAVLCSMILFALRGLEKVTTETALNNLVRRVDPVYPPLAKATSIQGTVIFEVTIGSSGDVTNLTLVSGHPLLIQAAKQALQQWTFKPFMKDGQNVSVQTKITVPFTLGVPKEAQKKSEAASNEYFTRSDECRSDYKAKHYPDAEQACAAAVEQADLLPPERELERVNAHSLYGQVFLGEQKFGDANTQFQQELAIAQTFLKDDEAELAYAFYHSALGLHVTGKPEEAASRYQEAERVLLRAREKIQGDFLKGRYAGTLKQIYSAQAALMQQMGDSKASAELQKRAEEIH